MQDDNVELDHSNQAVEESAPSPQTPIFNYHQLTGEYLGVGLADPNPLEPEDPIVPGYATTLAPQAAEAGRARVYRDVEGKPPQNWPLGSWTLVPDYRGVPLFRTADGSPFKLDEDYDGLGDLPPFLTDEPRPSAAHDWIDDEWMLNPQKETQQLTEAALATRANLLAEADALVAPLMDGFVLGELTEEEEAHLKALSQYRKSLRAVTSQPGFPREINWPVKPA